MGKALERLVCSVVLGLACIIALSSVKARAEIIRTRFDKWVASSGWTVTSYGEADESLYSGNKIELFNKQGESLGFYKEDFFEQVKIEGVGVGDGILNDTEKFLHYDFQVDDGKTCYHSDFPLGAYNNPLVIWSSVAVNPVLPQGKEVRLVELGPHKNFHPQWVQNRLLHQVFSADDQFFLPKEQEGDKRIDVYVGRLKSIDYSDPEALYMENATVMIKLEPDFADLNKDGFVDYSDLSLFADNWLQESYKQYNLTDFNFNNKVDFADYALLIEGWTGN